MRAYSQKPGGKHKAPPCLHPHMTLEACNRAHLLPFGYVPGRHQREAPLFVPEVRLHVGALAVAGAVQPCSSEPTPLCASSVNRAGSHTQTTFALRE